MTLQWFAAAMRDGSVLDYLPSLDIGQGVLERIIGTATSVDAVLHLAGAPPDWDRATKPITSWLACYDDADPAQSLLWVGYVNYRNPQASTDTLALTIISAEGYLEERYVGDVTFDAGANRDGTIATILDTYILDGELDDDVGIALQLDWGTSTVVLDEDLVLQNADNATVGARIRSLQARLGGEFTIDWDWGADHTTIVGTVRFGDRLGTDTPAGRKPPVQFNMPGQLIDFERPEDYSIGKGANKIVAYSTGSGSLVPYADPVYFSPADPDRPTVEYRYQPAPGISPEGLSRYALAAARVLGPGARAVKLTASMARISGRRFGTDWRLGDDLGYRVAAADQDGRPILAFPGGAEGVGRAIGVQIVPATNTISPILAEKTVYVESS